jgi:hypothetical protein
MPPRVYSFAIPQTAYEVLREAVVHNDLEAVLDFLLGGADVNQTNLHGSTLLMQASGQGNTEMARLLIEHGALLDTQSQSSCTALILASANGHEECARLLVDKGAALDPACSIGMTALDYARNNRHAAISHLLEEAPEIRRRIAEEKIRAAEAAAAEKERLRHENVSAKQQWLQKKARRRPGIN